MTYPAPFRAVFTPLVRQYWRLTRSMTLGVRVIAEDEAGRVALVRHSYIPGWHLPGGGVERGETAEEAARREAAEEAGVWADSLSLFGVYSNHRRFRGDHVIVFRAGAWRAVEATAIGEIVELAWRAPDDLPDGVTQGTRQRLAEAYHGAAFSPHW